VLNDGARNRLKRNKSRVGRSADERPARDAVLVSGVHREELAFGDMVPEGLDPSLADLLRIPEGLSGLVM
jgi:hypothetical protein